METIQFTSTQVILQAKEFAQEFHKKQFYPDGRPYFSHLESVAHLTKQATLHDSSLDDGILLSVSYLHDTIEDTNASYHHIVAYFGDDIAEAVASLTKNKSLSKQEQIRDSLHRILRTRKETQIVKLADRISNLGQTLLLLDSKWTPEYKEYYREESILINQQLGSSSALLSQKLSALISIYNRI
ncbi:MAG: bifunctional (p)ppGpp synthetase/guanosine-3',5'-bis(diphosphate) 3'-pyrophosphohydrolase [Oligoflexia bacterium]|nr:bifunctional (p)ppGpp synthetase/guanosine-3',5'-bis(diphosphate) 3'-pyrophosphohydrolase [Oligoflexia bacterium]